ncbi:MAG TPA: ABC transporter ATP-binding protein [Candidatus Lustribacter sp.]|jgi:branched-chain amino acid transport system ATP-binding protein|nr:ABC transporter ATP-binding protein [Candidatus Lustribacter sp.]
MSLLEVDAVNTYYGESHALFDVSMRVEEGEVVALLGRNGAGKTTTMYTIMGVLAPRSGKVRVAGEDVTGMKPNAVANRSVQLVPDTRRIVKTITVDENLQLAALSVKTPWTRERIYELFPSLGTRRSSMGRALSGGEQQMLAIARALIREPRLLLLDEPFEGLAPLIVRDLIATTRVLAAEGRTIVIVEQNVRAALALADRAYVLNKGTVVWEGVPAELQAAPELMQRYLGV